MTRDQYIHYADQYVDGARKISIRNTKPIVEKDTYALNLEHSYGNYDLYFNPEGELLYSVHFENITFRTVYGYDNKGQLVVIMQVRLDTGELMELATFMYDEDGRVLLEHIRENDFNMDFENSEDRFHKYENNREEILSSCLIEPDVRNIEVITYCEKTALVKDRTIRIDGKLVLRVTHEYRDDGSVVREIYNSESRPPYEVNEYLRGEHGLISVCKHRSEESSSVTKYVFTFDDRGEWTNRVSVVDGEPKHNVDRKIEYY